MANNHAKFFPDVRPGENLVYVIRRHWIIIVKHIMIFCAQMLVPPVIAVLFGAALDVNFLDMGAPQILLVLGTSAYALFMWQLFFHNWIDYYFDVWVVTDQRIINIEQKGYFSRTVSETSIVNIEDVTSEVHGKWQTFLDFGTVHIQSAGEIQHFYFEQIPHPRDVARVIVHLHDQAEQRLAQQRSS